MKIVSILLFLFVYNNYYAQNYQWKQKGEYKNTSIVAWDVNPLEEVIFFSDEKLQKLGGDFKLLFTQSERSFGTISRIDARHSLNTLLFSENQQLIGIVDNTLSFQSGSVDLADLNVDFATLACYSEQSDRFWIYDEQNSRLIRFEGIVSTRKQSEITNLSAITSFENPTSLQVHNNQLLLFQQNKGLYFFDYYGSLKRRISLTNAIQVFPVDYFIYILTKNSLIKMDVMTNNKLEMKLPYEGILDFRIRNQSVYFKDKSGIKKFSLIQGE